MIAKLIARIAMITSFILFVSIFAIAWFASLAGDSELIWDFFDVAVDTPTPPVWAQVIGLLVSAGMLGALGGAYWATEKTLRGAQGQDFLELSYQLRRTAVGLMLFWLSYNVLIGAVPVLLTLHLTDDQQIGFDWDPFDIDIVLLIVGIAIFAISHALHRAWIIEEENRQFL